MQRDEEKHSCFEWLQLIITFSIPVLIAIYTVVHSNRSLTIDANNREQDLDIADDEEKNSILRDCQMALSKLIEKYGIRLNRSRSVSLLARFTTLTAINQLDPGRRGFLIRLLYEARLINSQTQHDSPVISLRSANLTDLNLTSTSHLSLLRYASFEGALMIRAVFRGMTLHGVKFDRAVLYDSDFSSSSNIWACEHDSCDTKNVQSLSFQYATLTRSSFVEALYGSVSFKNAHMTDANLQKFICSGCVFESTGMERANLVSAMIDSSTFKITNLSEARLRNSNFGPNVDFYYNSMTLVRASNTNFQNCLFIGNDLSESVFDFAKMTNTTFTKSQMMKVSMRHNYVSYGEFSEVNMFAADLRHIHCEKCSFNQVNLTDVNLLNAVFVDSHFQESYLTGQQLKQATFVKTIELHENNSTV